MTKQEIIEILKQEVVPALGCTEPACVALATAKAAEIVCGDIKNIDVCVSPNIYKNGMSVGIPGSEKAGLDIAAAMGAFGGDSSLLLQVLSSVDEKQKECAYEIVQDGKVNITVSDNGIRLFCEAKVYTENGYGRCIIQNSHSNIVLVEANGETKCKNENNSVSTNDYYEKLKEMTIIQIKDIIETMDEKEIDFMLDGAKMNKEIANIGLEENLGMGVGVNINELIENGILSDDIYHNAVLYTAAGADARMSGYMKPVMSSAGSGNHGLTAILPVVIVAEKNCISEGRLAKALALSHMVTVFIKIYTGKLSALCGCGVAAATGASAAIAWMLGGNNKQIEGAIKNMAADVTGMICDGAKLGCSLKVSTAAGAAVMCACLALNDKITPETDGIVDITVEDTIKNMGKVSAPGMIETDKVILDVMVDKNLRIAQNFGC